MFDPGRLTSHGCVGVQGVLLLIPWCLVRLFVNNEDNNDNDSNNDILKTKPLKHSASFSLQGSSVSQ